MKNALTKSKKLRRKIFPLCSEMINQGIKSANPCAKMAIGHKNIAALLIKMQNQPIKMPAGRKKIAAASETPVNKGFLLMQIINHTSTL